MSGLKSQIEDTARKTKVMRGVVQTNAQIAADLLGMTPAQVIELCEMRIAMREDAEMKHIDLMLTIAAALGYEQPEDDGALLQALSQFAAEAFDAGYRWNKKELRFQKGQSFLTSANVCKRIDAYRSEWVALDAAYMRQAVEA